MMIKRNIDVKNFIIKNVKGRTCKELAELVNNQFGLNYSDKQIKYYKRKYNLKSGVDCRFKKGNTPHNLKGKEHEFTSTDGYTYIRDETGKFVKKHRYLYEKHYGKIPKGYSVCFLDTDKTNFDINNLVLINDRDKLVMKNNHLFTTDKELTKTGILLAQVINKNWDRKCNMKQ